MKSILFFFLLFPALLLAQWPSEPWETLDIDNSFPEQYNSRILPDGGAGGTIILWAEEIQGGPFQNIKMQKLNGGGFPQWTINGINVHSNSVTDQDPEVCEVGDGSFIVVWEDHDGIGFNIMAQRVSGSGALLWNPAVQLSYNAGHQMVPAICSDGMGGAIAVWRDHVPGAAGVYAQRVDSTGQPQWGLNGLQVSTGGDRPRVVPDGFGGAFCTWQDGDIHAQHLLSGGTLDWVGDLICSASGVQENPVISAVAGGAVIAWEDWRNTTPMNQGTDVYAQKVLLDGSTSWTSNGIAVCDLAWSQNQIQVASDEAGGAVISWVDARLSGGSFHRDIYLQRILANGDEAWAANGIETTFSVETKGQQNLFVDNGEIFITWNEAAILAQKLDLDGNWLWGDYAYLVNTGVAGLGWPVITKDGAGGAVLSYESSHLGDGNIYANHVNSDGQLAVEMAHFSGYSEKQHIILEWTTLTETDHDYFVIERSDNGASFYPIAEIMGKGTVKTISQYHYTDQSPISGTNYYRLKVVDLVGEYTFSEIISVDYFEENTFSIFPNPAYQTINVDFGISKEVTCRIYSSRGEVLRELQSSNTSTFQLPIADLSPGTYFLVINSDNNIETKTFVKAEL